MKIILRITICLIGVIVIVSSHGFMLYNSIAEFGLFLGILVFVGIWTFLYGLTFYLRRLIEFAFDEN